MEPRLLTLHATLWAGIDMVSPGTSIHSETESMAANIGQIQRLQSITDV